MADEQIGSMAELRDLLGVPTGRAVTKERTRLHAMDTEWLAVSPFCILATSDAVQETPETLEELEDYYATPNYSQRLY